LIGIHLTAQRVRFLAKFLCFETNLDLQALSCLALSHFFFELCGRNCGGFMLFGVLFL
jgi:hypothetical protein